MSRRSATARQLSEVRSRSSELKTCVSAGTRRARSVGGPSSEPLRRAKATPPTMTNTSISTATPATAGNSDLGRLEASGKVMRVAASMWGCGIVPLPRSSSGRCPEYRQGGTRPTLGGGATRWGGFAPRTDVYPLPFAPDAASTAGPSGSCSSTRQRAPGPSGAPALGAAPRRGACLVLSVTQTSQCPSSPQP